MRRPRTLGVGAMLLALSAAFVPGIAQAAAPTVYCVVAYGHENPGNCDPQPNLDDVAYRGAIHPTSQPFGYGEKGLLFVEGYATPQTLVTVTATDGTLSVSRTVETAPPVSVGDPSPRPFKADLKVTELGVHSGEPGNEFGRTELQISAVAVNSLNETSPVVSTLIDKYAVDVTTDALGATKDVYAPSLRNLKWPPKHWCHFSSAGMGNGSMPSGFRNFGGERDGRCSSLQQDGVGAAPDASWVMCIEQTSEASDVRKHLPSPFNTPNPFRSQYCRTSTGHAAPTGESQLSGLAEDDHAGAFGHASEIASIVIEIKQGDTLLKTITRMSRPNSTQGQWAETLKINDFAPNYPNGPAYSITVTVTDAAGHTASASQGGMIVYPW